MSSLPAPYNEHVDTHEPGSPARARLAEALATLSKEVAEIPIVAGPDDLRTGSILEVTMPHRRRHVVARAHEAGAKETQAAIDAALAVAPAWAETPFEERAAIFLRAADLLSGPWRARISAACMLGQSKTAHQSEIDAVAEMADFFRWNVHFYAELQKHQPVSSRGMWNRLEMRPLEGFVFAVTPFNFLAIAANLPCAPILGGNVCVWKPATSSLLGCWHVLEMLREAGLPDGVLNLVPGHGPTQSEVALASPHLAAIHFTGSTGTFKHLWKGVAANLDRYRTFPRLVGETGGKDFIVAHPSADPIAVATAISRGGYEYQGQKCSAASRIYVPRSLWPTVRDRVVSDLASMKMGDVADFSSFVGAVIDDRAFARIRGYQELARQSATILAGGGASDADGWFVQPTLVQVEDPKHRLMSEEIFGPVVTCFVYDDAKWSDTLELVDGTSPYALTGAVFARDSIALAEADVALRNAAGNFYVNDKPTGAVVGQQPFGGARASGTNDKAGSMFNLIRWISPRTVKETFVPPTDWRYPFLSDRP
ncbi:L-glutamate gamma-semialdehyde dehydrogenase [Sandaracinus amylolyticus]|uniref:L-glutamate gamma-semialdehyde dehydrogenase n=1 Tax=Sandaracinus amylolyticus TaxID=927083 RepID=UPI001F02BF6E|nr:L-glutamate gamma-semialdehyde dehydrogenase [Sandaracinus amylolyticus]UJR82117.1 L-glutamate gamma-semialdehyde dehydrogenase [Sandaracinus amylolyticus]